MLVCNGFLRSLAALDLPPSRIGSLAGEIVDDARSPDRFDREGGKMSAMSSMRVTGATGFIGGLLARRLLADGYEVRCLVREREADAVAELEAGRAARSRSPT